MCIFCLTNFPLNPHPFLPKLQKQPLSIPTAHYFCVPSHHKSLPGIQGLLVEPPHLPNYLSRHHLRMLLRTVVSTFQLLHLSPSGGYISHDFSQIQKRQRCRKAHPEACYQVRQIFRSLLPRACKLRRGTSHHDMYIGILYLLCLETVVA